MADVQANKHSVIRRRFPWGWLVLGLIGVMVVGGFLAQKNAPVQVSTVPPTVFKAGERNPLVTASGYIVARTRATLSSKVLGRISWLGVQEGSRVQQGQVIAKLEAPDLMASRNAVASQLAQTELDLARSQKLVRDGILDQASLDRLVNLAKQQTEQLKYQDALLESMVLRAPFTGVVTQKLSEVGETVAPGSAGGANAINAIAVLRAMGFRTGLVMSLLMGEGVMLVGAGGIFGVGLASLAAGGIRKGMGATVPFLEDFALLPATMLVCFGITVAVGLLSTFIPAYQATRRPITEGLRSIG